MATKTAETNKGEATTTDSERGLQKTRVGTVVSNKMAKTIVVSIQTQKKHASYEKYVQRSKLYYAHDERNECQVGDLVMIAESRPLSKLKRWRLREVIEKAS